MAEWFNGGKIMKRRVVVTGVGAISPIGIDAKTMWNNAKKGTNGISYLEDMDLTNNNIKIGGQIKNFNLEDYFDRRDIKRNDKFVLYALLATREAIADSKIDFKDMDPYRSGVYFGSGIGGLNTIAEQEDRGKERGYSKLSPYFIPGTIINIAAGNIAIENGIKGPALAHVTACATGTNSIGEAFKAIRDGYLEIIVTGGSEASLIPFGIGGFSVLQALCKSNDPDYASIPFDANRSGFVMGEGAGALILEEYEHAKKRGANIYAEIVGYGTTCDAYHVTSPEPEGLGAKNCMEFALKDAGIRPEDVDYINAHGTSTKFNDEIETLAIKKVFGEHAYKLNVSSTKSMTGHLLGATGAVEAIFTALSTKDDFVPPTINTKELEPSLDLNYTLGKGVEREINFAISNSLGFGGHNATLVFKKYKEEA